MVRVFTHAGPSKVVFDYHVSFALFCFVCFVFFIPAVYCHM